jgi:hypothetical protein
MLRRGAGVFLAVLAAGAFWTAASAAKGGNSDGGGGQPAGSAAGGDSNNGDVWVDTAGAAPGPGHENDPHLPCASVWIWGDKLADPSGSFQVLAWPPTGNQQVVFSGTWTYTAGGGTEHIATVPLSALQPGGHFKLDITQDPQKHKTFWVDCAAVSPSPSPTSGVGGVGGSPSPSPTPTPVTSPTPETSPTPVTSPTPETSPTPVTSPTTSPSPGSGVLGVSGTASPTPSGTVAGAVAGAGAGAGAATPTGQVQAASISGMPFTGRSLALVAIGILLVLAGIALLLPLPRPVPRIPRR